MAGKAAAPGTAVLLVTANVGSLFDDPENLQKNWLREFYQVVHTHKPHFMALHCQEFGGKNYEASMSHVDKFVKELLSSDAMKEYNRARVYLDENFKSQEHFTALGSFYFLHESLKNIYQFDFKAKKYKKVTGKEIYSDTLESTPMLEKEKFPQDYFPECKWSRKGFVRTRWCVADCAFDLVNIHLFHDASNLVAWETSPSVYSGIRHKALGYVLDRWVLRVRPLPPHLLQGRALSLRPLVHVCCFPIGQNTKFANVAPNPSPGPKVHTEEPTRLAVQRAEEKPLRLQAKASTALKTGVIRDTPSAWPAAELLLATVFPALSARGQQDVHMSPRASVRPEAEVAVVVCADVVWGPGPHRPARSTLLGLRALGPPCSQRQGERPGSVLIALRRRAVGPSRGTEALLCLSQTLCTKATMQTVRAADTNEVVKLIFRESDNDRKVMLQLEKKLFDYFNQEVFRDNNGTALLEFDKELSVFKDRLYELDISFPPSYPYSEDSGQGQQYMNTRCPAWCDRVLMSPSARELILKSESEEKVVTYDHIGPNVCMGDHKPVFLAFRIAPGAGKPHAHVHKCCVVQ
nr:inositol polyphosphate-5-phosphatase A [Mirounga angustirostris]